MAVTNIIVGERHRESNVVPIVPGMRTDVSGRVRGPRGNGPECDGDRQQNEKADCGGGCQPPETSPGHGQVSALPQAVSNSRVTGLPGTRRVSDRDVAVPRRHA